VKSTVVPLAKRIVSVPPPPLIDSPETNCPVARLIVSAAVPPVMVSALALPVIEKASV
jgi:hypothetical protein